MEYGSPLGLKQNLLFIAEGGAGEIDRLIAGKGAAASLVITISP
jgi:hypothetical protein